MIGWYRKLVMAAALLTLVLVMLGAYVRLSDAGLGCPDWPGCYGHLAVPEQPHELAAARLSHPDRPVEAPKAWKEMVHRYVASTLGFMLVVVAGVAFMKRDQLRASPWLPGLLVGVVIFQGLLGMWTVTLLLKPAVVTAHLLGGMTTLALLAWLGLRLYWPPEGALPAEAQGYRAWAALALAVVFAQIALGGWVSTNYAALACADFPECQHEWIPSMRFNDAFHLFRELGMTANGNPLTFDSLTAIHWMHRVGALLTFLYVGGLMLVMLRIDALRAFAVAVLACLALQIGLGVSNVVLQLPLPVAVAHNGGAACLLLSLVILNYRLAVGRRM